MRLARTFTMGELIGDMPGLILDVGTLLAPISPALPAGVNLREDEAGSVQYYRIKDARSTARIAERQADSEAERGALAPEWRLIFEQAPHVLAQQSKDLEIACWLCEAALRLHGFAGLRAAFLVLEGLVVRYWDTLYSLDAQDSVEKVAPLAGLNGTGADGSLIQPMRLAALTNPDAPEPASLWHYMVKRRRGAACREATVLNEAVQATDAATFVAIYRDIATCLETFTSMSARLDQLCGEDAPPSSTIRNTLIEAQDALRDISNLPLTAFGDPAAEAEIEVVVADTATVTGPGTTSAPQPAPAHHGAIYTREDALRELARIATFFRENEPNSPTSYTLTTLIRRARLPLADLLQELVTDEAVRRAYLNVAGIGPEVSEK